MFGLVERFIGAKMTEVGRDHALGDQTAFEAVVRREDAGDLAGEGRALP
jgi:hypothetical protein